MAETAGITSSRRYKEDQPAGAVMGLCLARHCASHAVASRSAPVASARRWKRALLSSEQSRRDAFCAVVASWCALTLRSDCDHFRRLLAVCPTEAKLAISPVRRPLRHASPYFKRGPTLTAIAAFSCPLIMYFKVRKFHPHFQQLSSHLTRLTHVNAAFTALTALRLTLPLPVSNSLTN